MRPDGRRRYDVRQGGPKKRRTRRKRRAHDGRHTGPPWPSRHSSSGEVPDMPVRVQLPELEHWKAQVKCQSGCPVQTDAGRYVQLIAEGRNEDAYLVARAPNPFASVCGRICAAPCEDACRRGNIDAPIPIRALKRFVTERHGVESVHPETALRL